MNPQLFSAQMGNPAMSRLYQEFKSPNNESANFQMPPAMLYQTMLLRAKAMKLMQVRNMQIQNQQTNLPMNSADCVGHLKQEPSHVEGIFPKISEEQNFKEESASIKMESLSRGSEPSLKSESTAALPTTPIEKPTVVAEVAKPVDSAGLDIYLKTEIEKIVTFLLTNMGKSSQAEIDGVRQLYIQNPCLLQIFDKLVMKYYSAKKCKEDIVRYILRRAFKIMRTSIMKREKVCSKKASLILCKKYFQSNFDEIQASGVNVENDDQLLELFMPYRKNSKIKTMNTTFVLEIFGSDDFCKEYQSFLNNFGNILNVDNNKKKDKLLQFLMECIKKNNFSKIGSYSRLPWLDVWMEDTKNIAEGLMPNKKLITNYKKTKH